jgi:predicted HicB family RNase H-like nuclease
VAAIGEDLRRAGAVGGEETARVADLLVASLDSTVRLHLLEALHEAARELAESAPGVGVDVRLVERDPVLSLDVEARGEDVRGDEAEIALDLAGELARLTVRLPEGLKERIEQVANAAGASVNSWIVVALARALELPPASQGRRPSRRMPRRMTGFVQG